jgi:type I restriction enzyme S subunit
MKIPTSWAITTIGDICKTSSGGTPSRGNTSYFTGTIPWVKSGELNYGTIRKTEESISELAIEKSSAKLLPEGTLLIALYGATVGKLAFLGVKAATNQAVCAILTPEFLSKTYLYFVLLFRKGELLDKRIGGAQPNISQGILRELKFPLPPLPEQHRIVAKIEELFSDLDEGIESLRKAKGQLKTYRQSVLKWAFEGKLTEEWRKKCPNQDCTDSAITTIQKKSGESLNPISHGSDNLPAGWKWVLLESLATAVDPQPSHRTPPVVNDGVSYVGVGDIDYESRTIDFERSRKVSKDVLREHQDRYTITNGDFVIGKIGTIGKPFPIPTPQNYTLSANVVLIKPSSHMLSPYLLYLFESNIINKQFTAGQKATTQAAFGIQKVRTLSIPLCPELEQSQIVSEIESRLSVADNLEKTIDASLAQADALRQSILKYAFEGKLVPQDPNDEPAEKLLERIKAEREESISLRGSRGRR